MAFESNRDVKAYVSNKQNTQTDLVLIWRQGQVLGQTLQLGSSVVIPVDVVHKIHQNHQWHDQGVNLAFELLLDGFLFFGQLGQVRQFIVVAALADDVVVGDFMVADIALLERVRHGGDRSPGVDHWSC